MSFLHKVKTFVTRCGAPAKFVAKSIVGMALPGSGPVIDLIDKAIDCITTPPGTTSMPWHHRRTWNASKRCSTSCSATCTGSSSICAAWKTCRTWPGKR